MKKGGFFLLMVYFFVGACMAGTLLENVQELKKRRDAGQISEQEFQELLKITLSDKGQSTVSQSTTSTSPSTSRLERPNSIPLQINFLITKYWRAKDLVSLTTNLLLTCNGKRCEGTVLGGDADKVAVAFCVDVPQGRAVFKISYRPKIKDPDADSWKEKNFSFDFFEEIRQESEINKVIDFIEVKGGQGKGSVADAKFLTKSDYETLLQKRRDKECKDKTLFDNFFRKR